MAEYPSAVAEVVVFASPAASVVALLFVAAFHITAVVDYTAVERSIVDVGAVGEMVDSRLRGLL